MATVTRVRLSQAVREVLEREGLGESVWRENDCISMVRGIIRSLSGQDNEFGMEAWECEDYEDCCKTAVNRYGTLEKGYFKLLKDESRLTRCQKNQKSIGNVGLSRVLIGKCAEQDPGGFIPVFCVIGPGYHAYTRAMSGIRPVPFPYAVWSVRPNIIG